MGTLIDKWYDKCWVELNWSCCTDLEWLLWYLGVRLSENSGTGLSFTQRAKNKRTILEDDLPWWDCELVPRHSLAVSLRAQAPRAWWISFKGKWKCMPGGFLKSKIKMRAWWISLLRRRKTKPGEFLLEKICALWISLREKMRAWWISLKENKTACLVEAFFETNQNIIVKQVSLFSHLKAIKI